MKRKKHPTILWEFFTAKSEHCSYWTLRDLSPTDRMFQTESARNDDAVRSAAADRIAIAHPNKPTVKEQHSYESNH